MSSIGRTIGSVLGIAFLLLCVWTAYANVFSDDSAVRTRAEQLAREKAGCGASCKLSGIEGSRGPITETITHYVRDVGTIVVTCRRAYIAFGDYSCTAEKR